MAEIITCPRCRRRLRLPDEYWHQTVQCPSCHVSFEAGASGPLPPMVLPVADAGSIREGNPVEAAELGRHPAAQERRPRTFGARPRKKKGLLLWLGLALPLLAAAVIVVVLIVQAQRRRPVAENEEERRQEVVEAFQKQKPLAAEEIGQELKPLFEGLGQALKRRDGQAAVALFDTERMLDELVALEVFPPGMGRGRKRRDSLQGLRQGMANALVQQAPLLEWTTFEIRHIKKLEGNEAVVIVRHRVNDGIFLKMRWWVTKLPGSWKIFDFEDLDGSMRFSTMFTGLDQGGLQKMSAGMINLRQAMHAIILNHDADAAERELKQIAGLTFPKKMEAMRHLVQALVHLQRRRSQDAIQSLDQALHFNPDMPVVDRLKATAFNDLAKWEEALKHIDAYEALLGDDYLVCFERAEALRGLGRLADACAAYRKALDYDPKGADAFLGLVRSLAPGEGREELGARFARLDNPHGNFDVCADDCARARDGESLEALNRAMRLIDPNYAPLDYYQALALAWSGQPEKALPLFKKALARQNDPDKRKNYLTTFLQSMVDAGKSLEAYLALPDARETFRILAEDMRNAGRPEEFKKLLVVHAKKHPGDPLLPLCQAQIHVQEAQYALADKAFEAALANKPAPDLLLRFRHERVLARYHTGKGMSAYADIEPKHETFLDLASMCLGDGNFALLQTLLDAHAKNEPDSLEISQFRIRLKIKQGQVAEGKALFKAALAREFGERGKRLVSGFLFDMLDAGQAVDGYQAAPNSREAFQILASDLLDRPNSQELKKLMELHRQKHPDDPLLALYQAEFHVANQKWDLGANAFAEAWARVAKEHQDRFRGNYVFAMYKAGRHLEAYRNIEPRPQTFQQLANLLIMDKKGAELEALLAAHRPQANNDPDLLHYEARAKVLLQKSAEAVPLFQKAYQKQTQDYRRRIYLADFLRDMQDAGQGLVAYRASPDKAAAFDILAGNLVFQKKDKELVQLMAEHGHDQGPALLYYSGELHLLLGEPAKAEKDFEAALAKAPQRDLWKYRQALNRSRVKAGKAADAYRKAGAPSTQTFEDLAFLCLDQKQPRQLADLIALHRQAHPEDKGLLSWDLEVLWLNQDYTGALKLLDERRQDFLPRFRWKYENHRVRCLAKLKRSKEAIQEAEAIVKTGGSQVLLVLAHASGGTAKNTIEAVEKFMPRRYLIEDCYRDAELGPILRSQPFEEFRQRFPPPKDNRAWPGADPPDDD